MKTYTESWGALAVLTLLSVVHCSYGDVLVISSITNKTIEVFADMPALFGPSVPLSGFTGLANYVMPRNACETVFPPPSIKGYKGEWIAVIKRNDCSFVTKIMNAQAAGYRAAIVYNVGSNSIQRMSGNGSYLDVMIPSVFVGEDSGLMIVENFLYNMGYFLVITDDLPFDLQSYLLPFAITIGICFIVMLIFMVVKCVRDYRRSRRHRLSSRSLKKLPLHKFKKGDPYECCAICLDDYLENDKLRVLPCSHAYHSKCIDPWLTKNRRVCPVCKRKVFIGDERPSDHDSDSEDEHSPLVNSEGGTHGGTFDQQRENPFQTAQRLVEERRRMRRRSRGGISPNIESGPEGYQRLADSTDDEDSDVNEDVESAEPQGASRLNVQANPQLENMAVAVDGKWTNSSQEVPNVDVIVHSLDAQDNEDQSQSADDSCSAKSGSPRVDPVEIVHGVTKSEGTSSKKTSDIESDSEQPDHDLLV